MLNLLEEEESSKEKDSPSWNKSLLLERLCVVNLLPFEEMRVKESNPLPWQTSKSFSSPLPQATRG